jgi:hypothetical protein
MGSILAFSSLSRPAESRSPSAVSAGPHNLKRRYFKSSAQKSLSKSYIRICIIWHIGATRLAKSMACTPIMGHSGPKRSRMHRTLAASSHMVSRGGRNRTGRRLAVGLSRQLSLAQPEGHPQKLCLPLGWSAPPHNPTLGATSVPADELSPQPPIVPRSAKLETVNWTGKSTSIEPYRRDELAEKLRFGAWIHASGDHNVGKNDVYMLRPVQMIQRRRALVDSPGKSSADRSAECRDFPPRYKGSIPRAFVRSRSVEIPSSNKK